MDEFLFFRSRIAIDEVTQLLNSAYNASQKAEILYAEAIATEVVLTKDLLDLIPEVDEKGQVRAAAELIHRRRKTKEADTAKEEAQRKIASTKSDNYVQLLDKIDAEVLKNPDSKNLPTYAEDKARLLSARAEIETKVDVLGVDVKPDITPVTPVVIVPK